jgi:3-phenylpropionate/trans-cinnamate dioxygenase ferredoxin subunit
MADYIQVATVDEVPVGTRKLIFFDDGPVLLLNVDGQFYCIADICTHDDGPLSEGELVGFEIECPRHGALFDIRTGAAVTLPATVPTPIYSVKVEGRDILVAEV